MKWKGLKCLNWKILTIVGLALAPLGAAAQQSSGVALYNEGKFAEAAKALTAQVGAEPNNQEALTYLGRERRPRSTQPSHRERRRKRGGALRTRARKSQARPTGCGRRGFREGDDACARARLCALLPGDGIQQHGKERPSDSPPSAFLAARSGYPRGRSGSVVPVTDLKRRHPSEGVSEAENIAPRGFILPAAQHTCPIEAE